MKKIMMLTVAMLVAALAVWGQDTVPEEPPFVGEVVALSLRYAQEAGGPFGPEAQERIRSEVRLAAQQMHALGYGEAQIAQAMLQGLREALAQWRNEARWGEQNLNGLGDLLRTRLRTQLRTADCDGTGDQLQTRTQEQLRTGPGEPVAEPPRGGQGGPGDGGKS